MSDDKNIQDEPADSELDELLDSALKDFDKGLKLSQEKKEIVDGGTGSSKEALEATSTDESWTKDFIKHAADQFEKNLQNLMQNENEDLGASFQKMAQTVASAMVDGNSTDGEDPAIDFQSAVARALKDLSETTENLQNIPEDLASMFGQTCLEDGSGDIFPFMENMMQSLLSKEILYPSLKELVDKYPEWLQSKEPTLSLEDLNKYKKQLQLMQKICTEFEAEKDDDTEELKRHRFKLILNFLQEMQKYGQPPEELVGEQPALFQFDNDDNPILSSLSSGAEAPKNCCLM